MSVLIIENDPHLGRLWSRHIRRHDTACELVDSQSKAIDVLQRREVKVVILNLQLEEGSTMAVTDYIAYRYPETKVILVSSDGFFSDGSVFNLVSSVDAMVGPQTPPEDMVALVEYHST